VSYEKKLMEMKKLLKKSDGNKKTEQNNIFIAPASPPYEQLWLDAGLVKEKNKFGFIYKRVVNYSKDYQHGNIVLAQLKETIELWEESGEQHPLAPDFTKPLLFFDTETTGLKGAGTLIFLLGFIEETVDGFTLTQYVLPGPDHEPAFLYATNLWAHKFTLVTYNGKSFDVPQLQTRWTMNRNILPALLEHAHIDLLHGSRRIWKEEILAFNLTSIEVEKLGFHREGDIPGFMAPIIYQDAVKSGNPNNLMKVLTHNEWDILSLVSLYIKATNLVLNVELKETAKTHTNIGKWFADLKSYDRGRQILESVINEYGADHPTTHYHFGFIMKRELANFDAVSAFEIAAEGLTGRLRIIALEELAKLYEHKIKDLEKAMVVTQQALVFLEEDINLTVRFRKRGQIEFKKREMRIFRKLFPGEAQ